MSKRHQSSRRRSYGRRQHELHEREGNRRQGQLSEDLEHDGFGASSQTDPLAFHDPRAPRIRFAIGE
ncbi:MAG: hypothetical protein H0U52_10635 [Chloroflexi bacterium]|nr:hypothetical protein [Chloroflexota bacterium]